eukprot:187794-Pleurochrysis_carterae.AAC.1
MRRLSDRALFDGYSRYRSDARPAGMKLADYAKADNYVRYNTGEPHPLDNDGAFLVDYVDPQTGWQM